MPFAAITSLKPQISTPKLPLFFIFILFFFFACKTSQKSVLANSNVTVATDTATAPATDSTLGQQKDMAVQTKNKTLAEKDTSRTDPFLENLLRQYPLYFEAILKNRTSYKVQIIYTQINRDINNTPHFKDYYFNVNADHYFYPASTVKMPVALLALQRLKELNIGGLNKDAAMLTESAYSGQTSVYNDPTSANGTPTAAQYIKEIFLVSDNNAFNRLYEFLGQQYINTQLHNKGYKGAQINHRLNISLTDDENRHTNPILFRDSQGNIMYDQPMQYNTDPYLKRNDGLGKGYYKNKVLINEPMDFSIKNRISLQALHQMMRCILFPQSVPAHVRFNLTSEDYRFVWQYMSQLPQETIYPPYDSSYYDASAKFLLLGADRNATIPPGIRIFNKIGGAYGFLTDVAYIVDFDNKVECMLSAVIYCNEDGILNDDAYDYNTVGFPFMKHLGEIIYQYELQRKRTYPPNLLEFKMTYDIQK